MYLLDYILSDKAQIDCEKYLINDKQKISNLLKNFESIRSKYLNTDWKKFPVDKVWSKLTRGEQEMLCGLFQTEYFRYEKFIMPLLDFLYSTLNPGLVVCLSNSKKILCFHGGFDKGLIEYAKNKTQPKANFDRYILWTDFCIRKEDDCKCKNTRGGKRLEDYMIHKEDEIYKEALENEFTLMRGHQFSFVNIVNLLFFLHAKALFKLAMAIFLTLTKGQLQDIFIRQRLFH